MCSCEHLWYCCTEATIIGIMVIFTSHWSWRQESILSRWAWLTKGDKNPEGFNQNQYSLYFNLNCFQVYIKLLCFHQCSSPSTCFVLRSLGKQVLPLYLKLLYRSTSLTCSVILLFYLDQCQQSFVKRILSAAQTLFTITSNHSLFSQEQAPLLLWPAHTIKSWTKIVKAKHLWKIELEILSNQILLP